MITNNGLEKVKKQNQLVNKIFRQEIVNIFLDTNVLILLAAKRIMERDINEFKDKRTPTLWLITSKIPINIITTKTLLAEFAYKGSIVKYEKELLEKGYLCDEISRIEKNLKMDKRLIGELKNSLKNYFWILNDISKKTKYIKINYEFLEYLIEDLKLEFQDAIIIAELLEQILYYRKNNIEVNLDFFITEDSYLRERLSQIIKMEKSKFENYLKKYNNLKDYIKILRGWETVSLSSLSNGITVELVEKLRDLFSKDSFYSIIKCDKCGLKFYTLVEYEKQPSEERGMGVEYQHIFYQNLNCPYCKNEINIEYIIWEYPECSINHTESNIKGCEIEDNNFKRATCKSFRED